MNSFKSLLQLTDRSRQCDLMLEYKVAQKVSMVVFFLKSDVF